MKELYYVAPPDSVFREVRDAAIAIWDTYDDTYGYASEKIRLVKDLVNICDNFMFIVAMFDLINQARLFSIISEHAREEIKNRLIY